MSDEKALLAAIWEYPHEDTPRLVFADWLQENGQPERAEFIRVQCELARLDEWDDSPRKAELALRKKQLWSAHSRECSGGLAATLHENASFHRGFWSPVLLHISPTKFLQYTARDMAPAPLWNFKIEPNRQLLPNLLASPNLLRVGTLNFSGWLETPDDVRQFVASPNVRNISDLDISNSKFSGEKMTELVAAPGNLPNLRKLNLATNDLSAAEVREFVDSALAERIEEVMLSFNPVGPEGVLEVARSTRLTWLRKLDFGGCGHQARGHGGGIDLNGEVLKALCDSSHLGSLQSLHIDYCGLERADIRKMCESRPCFQLCELGMHRNGVGDEGAESLAGWPGLEHVRVLSVVSCGIGAAGGRALVRSEYLNHVTQLWIQANPVLNDSSVMSNLRRRFGKALVEK